LINIELVHRVMAVGRQGSAEIILAFSKHCREGDGSW